MPNIQKFIQTSYLSNMQNLASYNTSSFDPYSNPLGLFMLTNSGTVDSRVFVDTNISKIYESEEVVRPNIYPTSYVNSFLLQKQHFFPIENVDISFYQVPSDDIQDETKTSVRTNVLAERLIKVARNIGVKLFEKLNWDQKIFMAKTAGIIEFERSIDINSVYSYIESYES